MSRIGQIIVLAAVILLAASGVFYLVRAIILEPGMPILIKVALLALMTGLIIVFLVVLRDRLQESGR
ncbi:MAG: hypothetical protein ACOCQH_02610 [Halanaerobiales bacterium]